MRNFTESNADIKLCPNPKCDKIIKLPGHGMFDIKCECGTIFCFKCLKESHRPCDCFMMEIWEKKSKGDENENTKWLLINTKQCPNCKKHIEKNQGCNHMTCRKEAGGCGYEFCWICLGEWWPHGTSYYNCTRANPNILRKNEEKINNIKSEMERYDKSFTAYKDEENALKFAKKLKEKIDLYKKVLIEKKDQTEMDLYFLDEALKTVIECHQILGNTYVFGYYMKKNSKNNSLYELHQEMLRREADLLHERLEMRYLTEILSINEKEKFIKEFIAYKEKVNSLISTTNKFKGNILEDIDKHPEYIDYNALKNA
jgi:ariadne-1